MKSISLSLSLLITLTLFPAQGTELEEKERSIISPIVQIKGPEDFKGQAEKSIAELPATYQQLEGIFKPLLYPEAEVLFQPYFTIFFDQPTFPEAIHHEVKIKEGWRCLYRKISYARTLPLEEAKKYQIEAIYMLLGIHTKPITAYNLEMGEKIPSFKCEYCLEAAKEEFGISVKKEKNNNI